MKSSKSTMTSVGLGLAALVFAFFLVWSDPQQGGQVMQQIQQTTSTWTNKPLATPTAIAPEGRMDASMPMNPQPLSPPPAGSVRPEEATSSIESYLDSAWKTPQAASQANAGMPNQFQQQPGMPFQQGMRPGGPQRMMNRGGFGRPGFQRSGGFGGAGFQSPGGFGGPGFQGQGGGGLRQFFNQQQQPGMNQQNTGQLRSAEESVRYELGVARSQAAQAYSCLDRVRGAEESSVKQSAASEARSHASEANAAVSRALSSGGSVPEVQGLIGEVRATANRAQDYADQAASAASGW